MKAARATGAALVVIGIVFLASASRQRSVIGLAAGAMLILSGVVRLVLARANARPDA